MSLVKQELQVSDGIHPNELYKVKCVNAKKGSHIYKGKKILELIKDGEKLAIPIKAKMGGVVSKWLVAVNETVSTGKVLIEVVACSHPTVLSNLCCDCGEELDEKSEPESFKTEEKRHVSMLHAVPDLKVSREEATRLGREDIKHLLDKRKLVLLVDLDQTLIHTTNDNIPPNLKLLLAERGGRNGGSVLSLAIVAQILTSLSLLSDKDVFHFQLMPNGPWYHTRLRPYTRTFLEKMSELYELHIGTFGVREYAHYIARFLDPDRKLFGDRILSRNECLDPLSKKANLSSLFPCGDNLVCIIDDRSDVWNFAPNVVQVMPYHFFQHTGDINAPPGLQKKEKDDTSSGFDFSTLDLSTKNKVDGKNPESDEGGQGPQVTNEEIANSETPEKSKLDSNCINKANDDDSKSSFSSQSSKTSSESDEPKESESSKVCNDKLDGEDSSEIIDKKQSEESIDESKVQEKAAKSPDSSEKSESVQPSNDKETDSATIPESVTDENGDSSDKESKDKLEKPASEITLDESQLSECQDTQESDVIDVEDSDDYLLYLEDILRKLHERFYENYSVDQFHSENLSLPDLKHIVPEIRSRVLRGANLVFSSVVPHHANLKTSKAYVIATSLGAHVSDKMLVPNRKDAGASKKKPEDDSKYTTHLVAVNLHTEKAHIAKKFKNIKIVSPNWLWCCAERWEWVDERVFALTKETEKLVVRNPPMHCVINKVSHFAAPVPQRIEDRAGPSQRRVSLKESLNPLVFLSNDDTKSMEDEVDDLLSDDEDYRFPSAKRRGSNDEINFSEDSSASDSLGGYNEDSEEDGMTSKKRKRNADGDEEEDDEDDLPSIRFRQGGALPSDQSDQDSADDDMNAYGDILERQLMDQ